MHKESAKKHHSPVIVGTFLLFLAGSTGCTFVGHAPSKRYVSMELQERTGYSLASDCACEPLYPGFINPNQGLTETDAVAVALWNSPAYAELLTDLGLSRAEVIKAGELQNPDFSILFPVALKQLEYTINVPFDTFLLPVRLSQIKLPNLHTKKDCTSSCNRELPSKSWQRRKDSPQRNGKQSP